MSRVQHPVLEALHRVRASGFLMGLAIFAAHMSGRNYSLLTWALVVLQFLAYPHLLHWHARRAANPMQAALDNFLVDALFMGLWSAVLGYPVWITFTLLACCVVSITLYGGARGAAQSVAVFFVGGLLWFALTERAFEPDTDRQVTVLCAVGLMLFLIMAANTAYRRNFKLRETRAALGQSEQALQAANVSLQTQLDEIRLLQDRLHEQANRDPLTGLYNRRYLDSTLARELARCKREGQPLSLMLLDIDHFKIINDTYGHAAGDAVLRQLAALLSQQARAADVACRYGGEEFLLLLPNMPLASAAERAGQWRAAFAASEVAFGELRLHATLSIGVAAYPGHGLEAAELIRRADEALYQAKTLGRNRVQVFGAAS